VGGWGGEVEAGIKRRLERGGRLGVRVEARNKKEARKGREAAERWEARGESRGQTNRRPERGGRLGGASRGQKGPFLLASSLSLSVFPALFIPLIQVLSPSVCCASRSSYSLFFSVLFLRIVRSEASCLGSRVSYEL